MIPVAKLNADYLYEKINSCAGRVEQAGGNVLAVICDGNRINQAFLKKFTTLPDKPWLTVDGKFLLFDFVHLLKNIRNLWLTEKSGQLEFTHDCKMFVAHWQHLRELYQHESRETPSGDKSIMKLSMLDEVSVYPRVIERQRIPPCLKVFCEKTAIALELYGEKHGKDVLGTVTF